MAEQKMFRFNKGKPQMTQLPIAAFAPTADWLADGNSTIVCEPELSNACAHVFYWFTKTQEYLETRDPSLLYVDGHPVTAPLVAYSIVLQGLLIRAGHVEADPGQPWLGIEGWDDKVKEWEEKKKAAGGNPTSVRTLPVRWARYDLIPWEDLKPTARLYEVGAIKYARGNYRNKQDNLLTNVMDPCFRHLTDLSAFIRGGCLDRSLLIDPENRLPYCSQVAWNSVCVQMHLLIEGLIYPVPNKIDLTPSGIALSPAYRQPGWSGIGITGQPITTLVLKNT